MGTTVQVHSDASSTPVSPEPPPETKSSEPSKAPSTAVSTSHTPPKGSQATTTKKTTSTPKLTANTSSVVTSPSTWTNSKKTTKKLTLNSSVNTLKMASTVNLWKLCTKKLTMLSEPTQATLRLLTLKLARRNNGARQIEFGRQERQNPTEESQFSSRFGTSRINAMFLFKFVWICSKC